MILNIQSNIIYIQRITDSVGNVALPRHSNFIMQDIKELVFDHAYRF